MGTPDWIEGAKRAMPRAAGWRPFRIDGPALLQVRFTTASSADRVLHMPGVERVDGATERFSGRDFLEAFKAFNTMADLVDVAAYI
jgi:D-aminopeptidase